MSNIVSIFRDRESRNQLKKEIFEANLAGKRLAWIMEILEVGPADIEHGMGMPESAIRHIVQGRRCRYYEEMKILCDWLNRKYKEKFGETYQRHDGYQVEEITLMWLLVGYDSKVRAGEKVVELLRRDYEQREIEYAQRVLILEGELERLKSKEENRKRLKI